MNILLIEDDSILNETIVNYLKLKGNKLTSLDDGGDAIKAIAKTTFDLYIIDINIPHTNGLDIVKYIRQKDLQTPIIITTASIEFESFKSAYKNGCDDYIKKPFYLEELEIRIDKLIDKTFEVKQIEQQNINLRKLANYDSLTEIRNRRCLNELLEIEVERSKRYQRSLSVIYMDVDHFKKVNDNYGHQIGDEVLIDICNITLQELRNIDIFGRWGGEEFLIILSETKLIDAIYTAERIRTAIEQHQFKEAGDVSVSLGVVENIIVKNNNDDDDDETIDEFVLRADKLLYKAKNNGRNCVMSA